MFKHPATPILYVHAPAVMGCRVLGLVLLLEQAFAVYTRGRIELDAVSLHSFRSGVEVKEAERFQEDRLRRYQCPGQRSQPRITKPRINLTFIHIPRCAGTSIEDCTRGQPVGWGHEDKQLRGLFKMAEKSGRKCFRHHVPPSSLPEYYEGKETFCVVRDPYERMISEFHFPLTKGFGEYTRSGRCNAEGLNNFTVMSLLWMKKEPLVHDCHLLPQTAFVYGMDTSKFEVDRSRKRCHHILRQENLESDFNSLMEEHGYGYRLGSKASAGTFTDLDEWGCTKVTPSDFTQEARQLINEVYFDDFSLLGYSMLE